MHTLKNKHLKSVPNIVAYMSDKIDQSEGSFHINGAGYMLKFKIQGLLQHNNAQPNTSAKTRAHLAVLGLKVLIHLPYSPDLASSDFFFGLIFEVRAEKEVDLPPIMLQRLQYQHGYMNNHNIQQYKP